MDFSRYGIKEGLIKGLKVAVYVAVSGAVTALAAKLAEYNVNQMQIEYGIGIMVANALIAGIREWLITIKPADIKKN